MESYRDAALGRIKRLVLDALAGCDARVYLFGSSARGTPRPSSDIDIAVEPRAPLAGPVLAQLREVLEESTIPYEVELVDLSETTPEFRERVRREGILWRA